MTAVWRLFLFKLKSSWDWWGWFARSRLPKGETEVEWWQKASSAAHRMLQVTHTQQSCCKIRAQLCTFKCTTIKWQQTQMFSLFHLHVMSAALLEHACYFASRSCCASAEQAGRGTKHWWELSQLFNVCTWKSLKLLLKNFMLWTDFQIFLLVYKGVLISYCAWSKVD